MSRLSELQEKYKADLDPQPIQEVRASWGQEAAPRWPNWSSSTSEEEGDEFFNPRPEYVQTRESYEPIPVLQ